MTASMETGSHESDWQSYLCTINGEPSSVFFDLAFAKHAPLVAQPNLAWLWIKLNNPSADGLSSDEEFAALCKFEDDLEDFLGKYKDWYYVGRITTAGRREFYFYVPDNANFDLVVDSFLEANPDYEFQTGEKFDDVWMHYFKVLCNKSGPASD